MSSENTLSRRALLGGALVAAAAPLRAQDAAKQRVAIVGTGHRGSGTWGRELLAQFGDRIEFVGLCDINRKRAQAAAALMGIEPPLFTDVEKMLKEVHPDFLIVTTVDGTHHEMIIAGLAAGCRVLTEKPMTTDEKKCQAILDAEKKAQRPITVGFNYRYSDTAQKMKSLLMERTIGDITGVDFHWYLNTSHGADYFRRWHAYRANSGTLFCHKATHHFDLVNWYLDAEPVTVFAFGSLRRYGKNGEMPAKNCRTCQKRCPFYWDMTRDRRLMKLYAECESEDGYLRDACVFRPDIDIFDTMTANVKYTNGAIMSYSLHAFMPYEGYHLAFNGTEGRIELRCYESQPWQQPPQDDIRVTRNFGETKIVTVPWSRGGHFGADPRLRTMVFVPGTPDPLKQRAGSRAGAMSVLTGVAAVRSVDSGKPVAIADLVRF